MRPIAWIFLLIPLVWLLLRGRAGDYRKRKFYRHLYTAGTFDLIIFGWRLLGKYGAYIISRFLGFGYAITHPSTMKAIRSNLALLDPDKAGFFNACRLIFNQAECFSTYGQLASVATGQAMELVGEKTGFEHLLSVQAKGQGSLLVTGHLGFFELGGLVMTEIGFPVTALTLPEPSTELTEWRANFRARWGVKTIVIGNETFSVVNIVRALNEGAYIATLIDRPYDGSGVEVSLPHGKILFSSAPVVISLLAKCPIIPVGVVRDANGKFAIHAFPPIEPRWLDAGRQETIEHYTKEIAASLVPLFQKAPEQWYHFSPLRYEEALGARSTVSSHQFSQP